MKKIPPLCLAMTVALSMPGAFAVADDAPSQASQFDLDQQVLSQGPMLLGNLRQAREEALRRDPWGMISSLQEARRLLYAMAAAERELHPEGPPGARRPRDATLPSDLVVPLGQPLEMDRPESGGREQAIGRFEGRAGTIPLAPVAQDVDRALAALQNRPPALGAALLATEDALRQVHWDKGLEPQAWAAARDRVLKGYALALDARPEARARLAGAREALAALPGGESFVQRLVAAQAGSTPDLATLSALVDDLDAKVRSLRETAEVAH